MEINSQIGFNVNPASEMASDLMAEGLSVEEAKDKVVEFANGFGMLMESPKMIYLLKQLVKT